MLADAVIRELQEIDDILSLEVEGDLQLPEDDVVIQGTLGLRLWALFLAPPIIDQAVEKDGQLSIAALYVCGVACFTRQP